SSHFGSSVGLSRIWLACLSWQRTRLVPSRTQRVRADPSRARFPLGRQLSPDRRSTRSRAGACRWHGRYSGQPLSATGGKNCRIGAPAPVANHLGHGDGGPPRKTFSSMVAPAQFRRRFTGKLGVSARHPRLLPHLAGALRHALDDDGGARRQCSSCARTEWWRSHLKARSVASGRLVLAHASPNFYHRRDEKFATLDGNAPCASRTGAALSNSPRLFIEQQGKWQTINLRGNEF